MKKILSWKEEVSLPSLSVQSIMAKVDTGSLYSVIDVDNFNCRGDSVHFSLCLDDGHKKRCVVPLLRMYEIKKTHGQIEHRPMIEIPVIIQDEVHTMKATLAQREHMNFRILIGRELLAGHFIVDVAPQQYL